MPSSAILEVPAQIALAISLASSATGADFDYLLHTAHSESGFKTTARAPTSSARGLFQFIEGTWLRTIKQDGPRLGFGQFAKRIFRTRNGRYYVPVPRERSRILALRNDPKVASMMAGAFARRNGDYLKGGIGRQATAGELYIAHFLGAGDAVKMIRAAERQPDWRADKLFPAAAKANKTIFYDFGRARSVRDVYRRLVSRYDRRRSGGHPGARTETAWSTIVVRPNSSPGIARRPATEVNDRSRVAAATTNAIQQQVRGALAKSFGFRGSIGLAGSTFQ